MKTGFCFFFFGLFAVVSSLGSPIAISIDSKAILDQLKIRIEDKEFEGIPDDKIVVEVKVTWKPVREDEDFPPRFELVLFRAGKPREARIRVETSPNSEGAIFSKFLVSKSEVEHTYMIFHNGQNTGHGLSLSDYLAGFPEPTF